MPDSLLRKLLQGLRIPDFASVLYMRNTLSQPNFRTSRVIETPGTVSAQRDATAASHPCRSDAQYSQARQGRLNHVIPLIFQKLQIFSDVRHVRIHLKALLEIFERLFRFVLPEADQALP